MLFIYLKNILEVYERKRREERREEKEAEEPLKAFMTTLRKKIQKLLERELGFKFGTFSIVFFKLYENPEIHYKYFFDLEQEEELKKRIADESDPLTEEDLRKIKEFKYGLSREKSDRLSLWRGEYLSRHRDWALGHDRQR